MADKSRLAKLKAETGKQAPEQSPLVGSKLETLSDDMKNWCRQWIVENPDQPSVFDGPDWRPRTQVQRENDWYDFYALQPSPWAGMDGRGFERTNFKVGQVCNRDRRECNKYFTFDREAIPKPKFPNPGQPATRQMWEDFWQEDNLWNQARRTLEYFIRLVRIRKEDPDYFNSPNMRLYETYGKNFGYLEGTWNTKHLPVPSDEQFEAWAFPERHLPAVGPGKRLVTYTDSAANKLYEVEEANLEPQQEKKPSTP